MKASKLLSALLVSLLPGSSLLAQSPDYFGTSSSSSTSNTPKAPNTSQPHITNGEDLRKFLVGTTWSWTRANFHPDVIHFHTDGTVHHHNFVAVLVVKDTQNIELHLDDKVAQLKFDPSYMRYHGLDFNGKWVVSGEIQRDLSTAASSTPTVSSLPQDPFIGDWVWNRSMPVTFKADGTCVTKSGVRGIWQFQHNLEIERHYRVIWNQSSPVDQGVANDQGVSVENVVCDRNISKATVQNQRNEHFETQRAVVTPAGGGQPLTAPDPLIGKWRWHGEIVEFMSDGTVVSNAGTRGEWQFLNNPETMREYRAVWSNGKFTDKVKCLPNGLTGDVVNTTGRYFLISKMTGP